MIYFLKLADGDAVKIGRSKYPAERQRHLEYRSTFYGTPNRKLNLIRLIEAEDWVEKWLHDYFKAFSLGYEWFTFHQEMMTVNPPDDKAAWTMGKFVKRVRIRVPLSDDIRWAIRVDVIKRQVTWRSWWEDAMRAKLAAEPPIEHIGIGDPLGPPIERELMATAKLAGACPCEEGRPPAGE